MLDLDKLTGIASLDGGLLFTPLLKDISFSVGVEGDGPVLTPLKDINFGVGLASDGPMFASVTDIRLGVDVEDDGALLSPLNEISFGVGEAGFTVEDFLKKFKTEDCFMMGVY